MEDDEAPMAMLFKQLPFQVGVKCMETSVLEIDKGLKMFGRNSKNAVPRNISSWKFPHMNVEDLDVESIIKNLRTLNLPGDIHYIHLAELLIDRLYYSIISSIRCVSMLNSIGGPERQDESGGNGDNNTTEVVEVHEISVANPLSSNTKMLNTNMALVINQLQTQLNDLETQLQQYGGPNQSQSLELKSPKKKIKQPAKKTRRCKTQTEISSIECCEVCTISQNAIRKVGELLENCFLQISRKDSALSTARCKIVNNLYNESQWSAMNTWCEALQTDTEDIGFLCQESVKKYADLEVELKKTIQTMNTNNRDHQVVISKLEKRCHSLETQLKAKNKQKTETSELVTSLQEKVSRLESELTQRDQELKKETSEKENFQEALINLEKVHSDLKYAHTTHSETLRRIQQDLIVEVKNKEAASHNLQSLETSNRKYRLEITQLKSDIGQLMNEKLKYDTEISELKIEFVKVTEEAKNNEKNKLEIENLKKEVKIGEQKIELLTLYPDLNGPINTPESDNEDVIATMENQLRGNTMRVQVLLQQSEKLAITLKKLKGSKK